MLSLLLAAPTLAAPPCASTPAPAPSGQVAPVVASADPCLSYGVV